MVLRRLPFEHHDQAIAIVETLEEVTGLDTANDTAKDPRFCTTRAADGGVVLLLAHKFARFVTDHGALYGNRVVWIKIEGIEGGTLESCVFMRPTFQLTVGIYGS